MFNSPIEEIKQRLDIIDVLSEYLQMKRTGGNYRALCPFHHEKTPSFMVSKEKQIWHCFGCSKGGDIFAFLQEIEGIEFPEALRILAKKANIELSYQDPKLTNKKTRLLDILKLSASWFNQQLINNQIAQKYLADRKVNQETIDIFLLGYAPDTWESLNNYLINKKYTEEEIFQAGLSIKKEKGSGYYDRFRGRLMFPIKDIHGSVVGFTGRLLVEDPQKKVGKYINTPQTMVYDKSQVIFGLDKAKQEIKRLGATIIVEGNMDVVSCQQAGFRNVVASSGTALTQKQVQLLKRYSPNLIISFDMDAAGAEAAKRGIEVAMQAEMNIKVLTLPKEFKDPDDCIKKDPHIFKEAIRNSQAIMEYYFQSAINQFDAKQVNGKKNIASLLLPIIVKIGDSIEQTHYLQKLSMLINVPEEILRQKIQKSVKSQKRVETAHKSSLQKPPKNDRFNKVSEGMMALILHNLEDFQYFLDNLNPEYITDTEQYNLYKKLIEFYNQRGKIDLNDFVSNNIQLKKTIDILSLLAEKDFSALSHKELQAEIVNSQQILERNYIANRIRQIEQEIKVAELNSQNETVSSLMQEFTYLTQKLNQIT